MADKKKKTPLSQLSGYFSPTGTAIPQAAIEAAGTQPVVSWTTPQNVTVLTNNPQVKPKKEPPFMAPRAKLVAVFKKHGIDNPYALEQLESDPARLAGLLSELTEAGKDSETARLVLPELARPSDTTHATSQIIFQNLAAPNPKKELEYTLFGKADNEVIPERGLLSRPTATDRTRPDFNPLEAEDVAVANKSMLAATRSFLDEARTGKTKAYKPVVAQGWTGGGGVPLEQTQTWTYEPFEPEYGE